VSERIERILYENVEQGQPITDDDLTYLLDRVERLEARLRRYHYAQHLPQQCLTCAVLYDEEA
jgi:hypothetical protein